MTHDELIKDLDACIKGAEYGPYEWGFKALRAVVELHKPVEVFHNYYDTGLGCSAPCCHNKYDEPDPYPCETIEAIEKELG